MNTPRFGQRVFLTLVSLLFLWVISPFLGPLAIGVVFGVLFYPLQKWVLGRFNFSPWVSALVVTGGVTLVFILPAAIVLFLAAQNGFEELQSRLDLRAVGDQDFLGSLVSHPRVAGLIESIQSFSPVKLDSLLGPARQAMKELGIRGTEALGQLLGQIPTTVMHIGIAILTIYFVLVDGPVLLRAIKKFSVFSETATQKLIEKMGVMCRSVVLASVVTGGAQATVFSLFLIFTGLPNVFLAWVLVFVASFVPVIGAVPVTLGYTIYAFLHDGTGAGVSMIVALVLVSTLDNFVRPMFLKGSGGLHPFLALLAALGGLKSLGIVGVFLGPILVALFLLTWNLWEEEIHSS